MVFSPNFFLLFPRQPFHQSHLLVWRKRVTSSSRASRQLALYGTRQPLVLSLRPLSRSLPALSSAVLGFSAELSVSDAMENEVDLWEI